MNKEDSKFLHMDWWGKCRTCRFWHGADVNDGNSPSSNQIRWLPTICENLESPLYGQETWVEGYCPQWDSFDTETALEVLSESNNTNVKYPNVL